MYTASVKTPVTTTCQDVLLLIDRERVSIKKFGVREIGVFGSFARGDHKTSSDVDVLVDLAPGTNPFDDYMGLLFFLEDLFGRKADLVTKNSIKPLIKNRILRETIYVPGF